MLLANYQELLFILIPFIAVIGGIALALLAILKDYQLRALMVEKGMHPEVEIEKNQYPGLRSGLTLTSVGSILVITFNNLENLWLNLLSQSILVIGGAQLIFYLIQSRHQKSFKRERKISH